MPYLFTSESVSEGHPDKVADQISDALLDEFLKQDPSSKVACETLVTTGLVVLSGEVKTSAYVDVQKVARDVIKKIGYTKSEYKFDSDACGVISAIHEQSGDINQGVERANPEEQGAGDQGMMFGYATNETDTYMPLALEISHLLLKELSALRKEGQLMTYLRPDAKSQVTIRYSDTHHPEKIDTIVISTQHDDFAAEADMLKKINDDVLNILIPRVLTKLPQRTIDLFNKDITYHINPTGKFVIGGPHGDTGLTGRKIIVDTYGGKGAHGGGAFSGKDSSKVDRSAAYAARHIAKNLVAAGVANQILVQVAYAIGVAKPVGLYVTTYNSTLVRNANGDLMTDGEISEIVNTIFEMRPYDIVKRFGLQNPIFAETAAYGHMGRNPEKIKVQVKENGDWTEKEVETFTWEKLDYVDKVKTAFKL
jgi:S-adenosylmethionine synthetase